MYSIFFFLILFTIFLISVESYNLRTDENNESFHLRNLKELSAIIPVKWQIILAIVLSVLSSLSSGLTLGLMTLDVVQLEVLAEGETRGDEKLRKQAAMAKRVLAVRRDGNLVLVSLLLLNVSVNSAFSILSSELTSGLVGLLVSTSVITLFGEILPQAVCAKYGLQAGYYLYPAVVFTECVLYVVAKPTALLLDKLLGRDIGTAYSKEQLKALVEHHERALNVLRHEEMQIVSGGFDVGKKQVSDAMTPLSTVFGVDVTSVLSFDTAAEIILSGYSRVPVFDWDRPEAIVGVFHAKDIALIDPNENMPLTSVMALYGRCTYAVDIDMPLLDLLREFKTGRSHLAVVREAVEGDGDRDPYYRHVGIITLEDVLEEILQDEIYDEYEQKGPVRTTSRLSREGRSTNGGLSHRRLEQSSFPLQQTPSAAPSRVNSEQPPLEAAAAAAAGATVVVAAAAADDSAARLRKECSLPSPFVTIPEVKNDETTKLPAVSLTIPPLDQPESAVVIRSPTQVTSCTSTTTPAAPVVLVPPTTKPSLQLQIPNHTADASAFSGGMRSCVSSSWQGSGAWSEAPASSRGPDCGAAAGGGLKKRSGGRDAAAGRLKLLNKRHPGIILSSNETQAVSMFLAHAVPALQPPRLTPAALSELIVESNVVSPPSKTPVFERGEPCSYMALVLQGRLKLSIGATEHIECSLGPWTILGSPAVGGVDVGDMRLPDNARTQVDAEEYVEKFLTSCLAKPFVPEYTATVVGESRPGNLLGAGNTGYTPVRLLLVTRKNYIRAATRPLASFLLDKMKTSCALAHKSNATTAVGAGSASNDGE